MRASREPVIVPGGSGGTARSPTASHEWLEARHRDGTRSLSGHARLQARRSDHSGQRGAAGTIRAIEKCLPRSSRQGVAQSPRTRPAPYKTAFGFIPPCLRPKPPHPPSGHYGCAKSRTTPSTSFHVVSVNPIAPGFRRLKAYKHLPALRAALAAHQSKYVTQRVEHDADAA